MSKIITSTKTHQDLFREVSVPVEKSRNLILPSNFLQEDGSINISKTISKQEKQDYVRKVLSRSLIGDIKEDIKLKQSPYFFLLPTEQWKKDVAYRTYCICNNLIQNTSLYFHNVIQKEFPEKATNDDYIDASLLEAFIQRIIGFHLKLFVKTRLLDKAFLLRFNKTLERSDKGYFPLLLNAISRRQRKVLLNNLKQFNDVEVVEALHEVERLLSVRDTFWNRHKSFFIVKTATKKLSTIENIF